MHSIQNDNHSRNQVLETKTKYIHSRLTIHSFSSEKN